MQPLIKLVKPTPLEVVFFTGSGLAMLILSNIHRFWEYFSNGVDFNEISQSDTYGLTIQNYLLDIESRIDPRFADFTVWIIIGIIAVTIMLFAQHVLEDTEEELEYTSGIRNARFKYNERIQYVLKILLRIAGVLLLLLWLRIFLGAVLSDISQAFFISLLSLGKLGSWFTLLTTVVVAAIGLYTMAICIRLMLLRIRVF